MPRPEADALGDCLEPRWERLALLIRACWAAQRLSSSLWPASASWRNERGSDIRLDFGGTWACKARFLSSPSLLYIHTAGMWSHLGASNTTTVLFPALTFTHLWLFTSVYTSGKNTLWRKTWVYLPNCAMELQEHNLSCSQQKMFPPKKHWEQGRANEPDMRNQTEVEYRNTRGKEYTGNTGEQEKWRENKQRQEVEG